VIKLIDPVPFINIVPANRLLGFAHWYRMSRQENQMAKTVAEHFIEIFAAAECRGSMVLSATASTG
jgi:hypothetical protein